MAARLRPVPDAPLRAIGLVRVSKERTGMISPEIQRVAIADYCERRGYVVTGWVEGIDESGSRARSAWWPRLDQTIGQVEAGSADVIVVWKFSRTARNRLRWAVALDRVESAGGAIESATEDIDATTATGRFTRGMFAEMAAFEAERTGDVWREVHARRVRAGLPANGKPRFGYAVVDGRFVPDPVTGPVLADLYWRYVAGESMFALAAWLNSEGIRTVAGYSARGGGQWSQNALRQMLDTGFGTGTIVVNGERLPGAHEPVVDPDLFAVYQAERIRRQPLKRADSSPYLLSGLCVCECGGKLGYGRYGRVNKYPQLRCTRSTQPGAQRHPGAYLRAALVEAEVRAWVERQAGRRRPSADELLATRGRSKRRRADAKALAREVIELDKAIAQLGVQRAKRQLPEASYTIAVDELRQERDRAEQRRVLAHADALSPEPASIVTDLAEHWDDYDVEHLRGMLRHIIDQVTVHPGPPVTVDITPK